MMTQVSASVEPSIGPVLDRFFVDEILSQVCLFVVWHVECTFFGQVLRWALATPLRFLRYGVASFWVAFMAPWLFIHFGLINNADD